MRENIAKSTEKFLKRCLKCRASITAATVVAFLITGVVALGETLTDTQEYGTGETISISDSIIIKDDYKRGMEITSNTTVISSGTVETSGNYSTGANIHQGNITNNGTIKTSGQNSDGIWIENGNTVNNGNIEVTGGGSGGINGEYVTIENNGTIYAGGAISETDRMSIGIMVRHDSRVTNTGKIYTVGSDSKGIAGESNSIIKNGDGGYIETRGNFSSGMQAGDRSELTNNGEVVTVGFNSAGLDIYSHSTVVNNGNVLTEGEYSEGMRVRNNSSSVNNGLITTTGNNSSGVNIHENSNFINNEEGEIYTSGDKSFGVMATDSSMIENIGFISTVGEDAEGINVHNNSKFENNEKGIILTEGYNSEGILGSNNSRVENNGKIKTLGDTGKGIIIWGSSEAVNNGVIDTEGKGSLGMFALATNGSEGNSYLENNGTIKTKGEGSFGMDASDNSAAVNSGYILTEGKYGYGMLAQHESSVKNNNSIETTGDRSYGIYGFNQTRLENDGVVKTDGNRSYGMYTSEGSTALNSENGRIFTQGEKAYGIKGWDNSTLVNSGVIITEGYKARGMHGGYESWIENSGEIATEGEKAQGIGVLFNSGGKNTIKGSIVTNGENAQGVFIETNLYEYDTYWNEEAGKSQAVLLKAKKESSFENNGSITTKGEKAYGIFLETYETWDGFYDEVSEYDESQEWEYNHSLNKGSRLENYGTVATSGNYSFGIYSHSEEGMPQSEVYNYENGIVKTTGDGAKGIYLENSILLNKGTIETFGDKAYGIYSDHSDVDNSGVIRTHGEGSYGIYAINKSAVNHTGKIYVDDPNAYGIVYDETSEVTVSKDAILEIGGDGSNGIQVISTIKPVVIYSEPTVDQGVEVLPSTRRAVRSVESFAVVSAPITKEAEERAQLNNQGSIFATGEGANAVVLNNADLMNTGSISSDTGYPIVSTGGINTVTLTEGSNVDGIIKGGSGSDTLYLDGTNRDDFNVVGYNRVVKTGGGVWTLENSSIQLETSKELSNVSSYAQAVSQDGGINGDIVIGDNSTVTIKVDETGNSGQMIASAVTIEGDVSLDIDSSNNNGARELDFENMVVTEKGVTLEDEGDIRVISDGWKLDYQVDTDGTVDVELSKVSYKDRVDPAMSGLAHAFEKAYDNASGHMRGVMNVLNDSTDEEFNSALKQICTDEYSSAVSTAVNASMSFQNNIRGFMNGGTSRGTAVRSSREGLKDNYIYATLIGNTSSYDGDSSTTGFDSDSYGAVGAYEFGSGMGFSLGYLATDTDYEDGRGSKSEADTYHIGTFYKYDNNRGLRVNTDLALDYTTNDVERRIAFGGITETARSDFDSYIISVGTEIMYDFYLDNNFRVTPKAALTYGRIEQESFTESGASSLNVSQDSQSYNSIRTSAGVEVAKEFIASSGTYELSSYAQWNHEFGDIYDDQEISIQDLEGKFVVPGLNVSEDTYEVGVGAEYTTNSDTTYFITYSYEGESSYDNHTGKLGVKYRF